MHALDIRTENINRVNGVRLSIQDEVGRVQADSEVRVVHVPNDPQHSRRGLLPGLHQEGLTVTGAMPHKIANRQNRLFVERVGGVFGNETAVRLYVRNAKQLCEVGSLLESVDTCLPCGAGYYTNGRGALGKVPFQRPRLNDLCSGRRDPVLLEQPMKFLGE